jgi:hypothetical protein
MGQRQDAVTNQERRNAAIGAVLERAARIRFATMSL